MFLPQPSLNRPTGQWDTEEEVNERKDGELYAKMLWPLISLIKRETTPRLFFRDGEGDRETGVTGGAEE